MTRLGLTNAALGMALGCAISAGCGDDSDDNSSGDASTLADAGVRSDASVGDGGASGDAAVIKGVPASGMTIVMRQACATCHTGMAGFLAGQNSGIKGANITPDLATGIGSWTEAQIVTALLTGKDDEGKQLCTNMPIYATVLSAQDAADVAAYLKTIPPINNRSVEACQ